MLRRTASVVFMLALALGPRSVLAQDTRDAVLAEQRAEKAKTLAPYEGGRLERALLRFETADPLRGSRRTTVSSPVRLSGGSRSAAASGIGGGWRHDLFNRNARVIVGAGISTRNYQMLQADFSLPYLASNRVELGVHAVYRHNPQEDFWGVGLDSSRTTGVNFLVDYTDYEGRAIVRP